MDVLEINGYKHHGLRGIAVSRYFLWSVWTFEPCPIYKFLWKVILTWQIKLLTIQQRIGVILKISYHIICIFLSSFSIFCEPRGDWVL
jgi:hypothetical protein